MDEQSFEAQMAKLRSTFLERLAQTRGQLDGLISTADIDGLINIAHRLKGSAGNYGFTDLGEAAAATEKSLAAADATQVQELAAPLIAAIDGAISQA